MAAGLSWSSPSSEEIAVINFATLKRYLGSLQRNVENNGEYVAFYGVPYAKRPEGIQRYQAPKAIPLIPSLATALIETYDAREINDCCCVQFRGKEYHGTPDCLYLNIYLPRRPCCIAKLLPVLVFIHGGGFTFGSYDPKNCPPDSIVQHDVIFVTVNYRLGLQGFLNMQDSRCPGNAGLKDQVKALEWIRDNIESFKGDPKNVTISGSSAGATCVNLHLIAPMSKGLFQKAIVQSGGVYCPWGYQGQLNDLRRRFRDDWECNELLFSEVETKRLHERVRELMFAFNEIRQPFASRSIYGPTKETIEEGAFIAKGIEEMMQSEVDPNIPILAGVTVNEGTQMLAYYPHRDFGSWISNDFQFRRLLMDSFRWSRDTASGCVTRMTDYYCPYRHFMTEDDRRSCIAKIFHDIYFRRFYDNFKFGPERTLHKNLYVYQFEYFGGLNRVKLENLDSSYREVSIHGDELNYLYLPQEAREQFKRNNCGIGPEQDPEIRLVTAHMCSLWANFCKTGIPKSDFAPHVKWKAHTEDKPCYLRINKDLFLQEGERLCEADWDWLNSLVNNQPVEPSDPPTPDRDDDFL